MCGIAGTYGFGAELTRELVATMCRDMVPRGPDDGGTEVFRTADTCVGLGSRRLAIIDPTPAGHQPMIDLERGIALVFNGMIYNFAELRRELVRGGERFRSQCDTEVVLRAYGHYGRDFLCHLHGMFALAIWDQRRQELFLARDRLGIKPLYVFSGEDRFVFASQVKTLLATDAVPFKLSREGLESYLATAAVHEPLTMVEAVRALPAGHFATITSQGMHLERWWDFPGPTDAQMDRANAVAQLRNKLRTSVDLHLVADAPVGVFLSGGLDSSLIASLAADRHPDIRTLSVTFGEQEFSEDTYIDSVVARLGTHHVNVRLSADQLVAWSQEAFTAMDQPSYDGINIFTVSRAAAESGLKVALSGLGADELFNGYGFIRTLAQLERLRRMPQAAQVSLGLALAGVPGSRAVKPAAWLRGDLPPSAGYELLRRAFMPREIQRLMPGQDGRNLAGSPRTVRGDRNAPFDLAVAEMSSYMRNVLLRDTDAMSMSQSLEVRVPFLDDAVVDWALRQSPETRGTAPKSLLLEAAQGLVPNEVLTRPKQGFVLPLEHWMRDELRTRMDALFSSPPSVIDGVLDPRAVRRIWDGYQRLGPSPLRSRVEWIRPWTLYVLYEWIANVQARGSDRAPIS